MPRPLPLRLVVHLVHISSTLEVCEDSKPTLHSVGAQGVSARGSEPGHSEP